MWPRACVLRNVPPTFIQIEASTPRLADGETVAVRVSGHPVVNALCTAWGGPLVSSSANRAGAQAPRESFQVRRYFGGRLDYILPGAVGRSARPSVIRDLASGRILRS